jgi:hypothetical protein
MTVSRTSMMIAAGLLAVGLSAPSLAASDDGSWWSRWGMGHGMMDGWGWGGPMMGYGPDAMLDRIDGRLAYMKTELKITDAQAAAWDEVATVIRDTAETHNAMMREMMKDMRSGEFLEKPLPERLTIQQTHMEARLEQIKAVKAAVDKLYALLDDAQKKTADDIVLPSMGMGMGRGMGRGMMNWD